VYTIFKNLTIILIAYGEVFMFNGIVTGLTLASFALMVSPMSPYSHQDNLAISCPPPLWDRASTASQGGWS
jgi:GDP-mannose transporter